MKKAFFILFACLSIQLHAERIPLTAHFSTSQIAHKLFQPNDQNIPHPVYKERCKELPPPEPYSKTTGSSTLLFDPDTNELHYALAYSGLSGQALMIHFHLGAYGVGGPIIQTIVGKPEDCVEGLGCSAAPPTSGANPPEGNSGFIVGTYKLQGNSHFNPPLSLEEEKKKLLTGEIYINIHTCLNEQGELRGQIVPQMVLYQSH